jgi:hypothetical protein
MASPQNNFFGATSEAGNPLTPSLVRHVVADVSTGKTGMRLSLKEIYHEKI